MSRPSSVRSAAMEMQRRHLVALREFSVAYLMAVAVVAALTFPDHYSLAESQIRTRMPADSVAVLDGAAPRIGEDVTALMAGKGPTEPSIRVDVEGRSLPFPAGTPESIMQKVAKDYYDASTLAVRAERQRLALVALAWWAIPCLAVYVLGRSVAWVGDGFRSRN